MSPAVSLPFPVAPSADPDTDYACAVTLREQGQWADAEALLARVLVARPDHAAAWGQQALALLGCWRVEAALTAAEHAVRLNPALAMAWRAQAMALLRLGRLGDAELTCLKGLRKIGSNAELLATLATLRMAQARLEESDTLFARALAANPDLAEAYANRARLRDRQGRPEEAVPDLVRAVEIKPWLRSSADIATRLHLAELLAQGSATTDLRTVLHVGCGPKHDFSLYPAFKSARWREIRLDIDPAVAPDIVASITNMATVASASVEVVWSSHNLEHLYDHEIPRALREFRRVLKPGGALLLVVPDFLRVAELFASGRGDDLVYVSASGPVYPLDMAFGMRSEIAKGHTSMTHHTAFTPTRLEKILDSAGFTHLLIQRDDNFNIWATSRSPGPE